MNDQITETGNNGSVASRQHTAVLCGILIAVAAVGFLSLGRSAAPGGAGGVSGAALYLPLLAAEWGLFLYVRMGLHRGGNSIRDLIGTRPLGVRTLLVDLLLGLLLFAAWLAVEYGFDRVFGSAVPAGVQPLLVRHAADIPLWILLALSAGFVEELVFRGYLQRQFGALLGSRWAGVIAQAAFFGVTHGYQGALPVLKITLFGLMFGAFALARRSLVPGMAAHAAVDVIGGLAVFR
jgi:membrane protease YdiL (CAAX protease family)